MKDALNDIKSFSNFSGLHSNLDNCKIPGIGVLNVNVALFERNFKSFGSTYFLKQENSRWLENYQNLM